MNGPVSHHNSHLSVNISRPPKWTWRCFPRRYLISILAMFGCFNIYTLRVNLSLAAVAMTKNETIIDANGTTFIIEPEFDWDEKQIGFLLSSFFFGYITTQLLAGWIAPMIGGGKLYGMGILTTALLTLVTPLVARLGYIPLVSLRIIEGFLEGVTFPALFSLWSHWAPPFERSKLLASSMSGTYFGIVTSMAACGKLAESFGWPSIFYTTGTVALLWCIAWFAIVRETPREDPYIQPEELEYIEQSVNLNNDRNVLKVPWKALLTSLPLWAITIAHFCENWGFYTMLTLLPKFLDDAFDFKLSKTGFLSAIPYVAMSITVFSAGYAADWLRSKRRISTTSVRKLFTCLAFVAQATFMLSSTFADSPVAVVTCLTLAVGIGGLAWAGFSPNKLEIAPQFASIIMGISNTFGTMPGMMGPTITGFIVQNKLVSEWHVVFYITAGMYIVGCIIYGIFASGELQPWAVNKEGSALQVIAVADDVNTAKKVEPGEK